MASEAVSVLSFPIYLCVSVQLSVSVVQDVYHRVTEIYRDTEK